MSEILNPMNQQPPIPQTTPDNQRIWLEVRMARIEDEQKYLRQDFKRLEDKVTSDLAELKELIKGQAAESKRNREELHRELNLRVQPIEKSRIWITGWITGASVIVGVAVSFIKQMMGW